jgi:hypothetical protein
MKKIILIFIVSFLYANNLKMTKEECEVYHEKMLKELINSEKKYNEEKEDEFKKSIENQIKIVEKFNEEECYTYFKDPLLKKSGENLIKELKRIKKIGIEKKN